MSNNNNKETATAATTTTTEQSRPFACVQFVVLSFFFDFLLLLECLELVAAGVFEHVLTPVQFLQQRLSCRHRHRHRHRDGENKRKTERHTEKMEQSASITQ